MKNKKELIILISIVVILLLVAGGIIIKNINKNNKMVETIGQATEENLLEESEEVNEIEENAKLDPAEYSLVSKRVSSRVYEVQKERQMNLNKKQIGELFRALNRDILEITGVKTRTQLRQKHLDMVLDFINDWYPSRAAMFNINQMSLEI